MKIITCIKQVPGSTQVEIDPITGNLVRDGKNAKMNPYDLVDVPAIQNYVCLYEYTPNSVRVLKEYLKGNLQLKGKVPIQNG